MWVCDLMAKPTCRSTLIQFEVFISGRYYKIYLKSHKSPLNLKMYPFISYMKRLCYIWLSQYSLYEVSRSWDLLMRCGYPDLKSGLYKERIRTPRFDLDIIWNPVLHVSLPAPTAYSVSIRPSVVVNHGYRFTFLFLRI